MEKGLKITYFKEEIKDRVCFMAKEKFYFCVCSIYCLQFLRGCWREGFGVILCGFQGRIGAFLAPLEGEMFKWNAELLVEVNFSLDHHSSQCFQGNAWFGTPLAWMTWPLGPLGGHQTKIPSHFINFLPFSNNNSRTIFGFAETRSATLDRIEFPLEVESYRIGFPPFKEWED